MKKAVYFLAAVYLSGGVCAPVWAQSATGGDKKPLIEQWKKKRQQKVHKNISGTVKKPTLKATPVK